ncbi:carnitine O-acetyltransferase [Thecamonas trahens ATCC 50062]|uniref:Carnitine O-acetyltransferase n=1 Tax=Thecamonas trahens ATCC 50062 TaxID=461836 RepID=A0A0L0DMC0_THETB|nr:carnitine O-acetyltransferase [Thecamonas trahens ATCC 50062]KNC53457.1 carnitine O-acetyltransferase [Thecamonas trahens ATCC 50062]|eukprot:XP_013761781.1 carnitine O-acetyltransferase [Thecamonas trahens ATCC 50062]
MALPPLPVPSLETLRAALPPSLAPFTAPSALESLVAELASPKTADALEPLFRFLYARAESTAATSAAASAATADAATSDADADAGHVAVDPCSSCESWLSAWWLDAAYLAFRAPLVVNSNYAFVFDVPLTDGPYRRAAALMLATRDLARGWHEDKVIPGENGSNCTAAYPRLFNSCRLPAPGSDVLHAASTALYHVVVWAHGHPYVVELGRDGGDVASLASTLVAVVDDAAARTDTAGLGVLCALPRDEWLEASTIVDADGYRVLQDALFELVLEADAPAAGAHAELVASALTTTDGWLDKTLSWLVYANGALALNGEHSGVDGMPMLLVTRAAVARALESEASAADPQAVAPPFARLDLVGAAAESLAARTASARAWLDTYLAASLDVAVLRFDEFGKDHIKAVARISPDAFCQAAIQAAYYALHGTAAPTYESVTTRRFAAGRTETLRAASPQMVAFVESLVRGDATPDELEAKARTAAEQHSALARAAASGAGVDRLLLGLQRAGAALELSLPHALVCDATAAASTWALSTSQVTDPVASAAFGPVVDRGFGVCYGVRRSGLVFNITSQGSARGSDAPSAAAFASSLDAMLQRVWAVFARDDAKL